ncbi:MAG: hypothetical protein M1823_005953 [Watsoniomyces obsoletus]|nr:MAG: hypothetical protein M1823_005953 [Watsoniomyces obsoletus]
MHRSRIASDGIKSEGFRRVFHHFPQLWAIIIWDNLTVDPAHRMIMQFSWLASGLLLWMTTTVSGTTDQNPPARPRLIRNLPGKCVNDGVYERIEGRPEDWRITDPRMVAPRYLADDNLQGHDLTDQEKQALRLEIDAFWRGYHTVVRTGSSPVPIPRDFDWTCLQFYQKGLEHTSGWSVEEAKDYARGYRLGVSGYKHSASDNPRRRQGMLDARSGGEGIYKDCFLDGLDRGPVAARDPLIQEGLLRGYSKGTPIGFDFPNGVELSFMSNVSTTSRTCPRLIPTFCAIYQTVIPDTDGRRTAMMNRWFSVCLERVRLQCQADDAPEEEEVPEARRNPNPPAVDQQMQFKGMVNLAQDKVQQWTSNAQVAGKAIRGELSKERPSGQPRWKKSFGIPGPGVMGVKPGFVPG